MRFCPECNNLIVPRNKKLYCKACGKEFGLALDQKKEYKIIKTIKHDEHESAPIIIKENLKGNKISGEDRKAFEEFFSGGEENGY